MKNVLKNKIKSSLFSIGLNEKYVAFEYLSIILTLLIKNKTESESDYDKAIEMIMDEFNVAKRTITQGLNNILKTCNKKEITSKLQYQMGSNALNKIKVIKQYIEQTTTL